MNKPEGSFFDPSMAQEEQSLRFNKIAEAEVATKEELSSLPLTDQETLEFFLLRQDAQDQLDKLIRPADPSFLSLWQELQTDAHFQPILQDLLQSEVDEEDTDGTIKKEKNWLNNVNHPLFVAILENIYQRILQEKVNAKHARDQEKTPLLKEELKQIIPEVNSEKYEQIVSAVRRLFVGINPEDDITIFEASLSKERKFQLIADSENQNEGLKRALFRYNSAVGRNKDVLTGAWNRHAFKNYLNMVDEIDALMQTQTETQRPPGVGYAITTFDFDHFKTINDTYGHTAGDEALKAVVQAFQNYSGLRKFDFLFRQGGDEWALIMPLTDNQDINSVIYRIIQVFRDISQQFVDLPIHDKSGQEITHTITFSAGTQILMNQPQQQENSELQDLLDPNRADSELYLSKTQSRNRITISYTDEDGETISRSAILNRSVGNIS